MTRQPSFPAVLVASLVALALLAAAVPATADGLPTLNPGFPGYDCGQPSDAANSYANATYVSSDGLACTGLLTPVVDDQDWYQFWASEGTDVNIGVLGLTGDVDICAYSPSDAVVPLACSAAPLFLFDGVWFRAEERGYYRLQLELVTEAGPYTMYISSYEPPPFYLPDVAVLDLQAEKPVLRTDLVDTGVVNPLGAWKLSAALTNLGQGWACPEVWFFVQGEPLLPRIDFGLGEVYGFQQGAAIEVPYPDCLGHGDVTEVSVDWRPGTMVGDVVITVVAYVDHDADWDNNQRSLETFVLVGGL